MLDDEGGFLAPTAAERLDAEGFTVEIATTHPAVGEEIDPTQQPFVFRRLALAGVVMTPHMSGVSSDAGGVTLRNIYTERDERREGVGLVVMAGDRRAVVGLRDELTALRPELRLVVAGDALAPRTLLDAVTEGARAGADVVATVQPCCTSPITSAWRAIRTDGTCSSTAATSRFRSSSTPRSDGASS